MDEPPTRGGVTKVLRRPGTASNPRLDDGPALDPLARGTVIGNYRLERALAAGGMGVVWVAQHRYLDRAVALKVAVAGQDRDARVRDRFVREAWILTRLDHPGVARVHDFGFLDDGRPWLAMELLAGETVAELADAGRVAPARALDWLRQIARALTLAHGIGIVHRDLKPDNVFVATGDRIKVLDWGIAFVAGRPSDARITQRGVVIGTPAYLAPEQARGLAADWRCDVYALGVLAYELLARRLPFEASSDVEVAAHHVATAPPPLSERWPEAPAALDALLGEMLAKDPDRRPDVTAIDRELGEIARALS